MAQGLPTPPRRAALLGDLRIILLGTWAFLLQILRSRRLSPQLLDRNDDPHDP